MRVRLIFAAAATLALAACAESSTSPKSPQAGKSSADLTCRSGYHIATRADGSQYCEADGGTNRVAP